MPEEKQLTRQEFSLMVMQRRERTNENVLDIIVDLLEDENIPVYIDNVKRLLTDQLKEELFEDAKKLGFIKDKFHKKGLFKLTDLM